MPTNINVHMVSMADWDGLKAQLRRITDRIIAESMGLHPSEIGFYSVPRDGLVIDVKAVWVDDNTLLQSGEASADEDQAE